ncbi:glycosyltransferase family 4 protein [Candidatus Stoquefichus sp. SB1]|uniref:glycosyltransferase family 4 protein n=1 Tax=Candidatus Stoquefichus sp. SB1 TaxID=1658109 RepID=UPI00067E6CF1|nr:glycosyltransferase [Candidatus Stoquefichus sp. SB1]
MISKKTEWGKKYDIVFVLPMPTNKIVGGYKMVYEYSNYLVNKGLTVCLIYNGCNGKNSKGIPKPIILGMRFIMAKNGPKWFDLDKRVVQKTISCFDEKLLPSSYIYIATVARSAIFINSIDKAKSRKIYFIQGYEDWEISEEELHETYSFNMKKITVSKWLKDIISKYSSSEVEYLPNGINCNIFTESKPFNTRNNYTISMLFHNSVLKGANIGIDVLLALKEKYPLLEAHLFGTPKRPDSWPEWIKYTQNASPYEVSAIMNNTKVFLCTSKSEGYGLTVLEAMSCGCAIVTTKCGGINEFTTNNNTLYCEIDDKDGLIAAVSLLFNNNKMCKQFGNLSLQISKEFNIDYLKEKFYLIIQEELCNIKEENK